MTGAVKVVGGNKFTNLVNLNGTTWVLTGGGSGEANGVNQHCSL